MNTIFGPGDENVTNRKFPEGLPVRDAVKFRIDCSSTSRLCEVILASTRVLATRQSQRRVTCSLICVDNEQLLVY